MPKAFPKEFKEDVLRVARNRGPDTSVEQIAKDFVPLIIVFATMDQTGSGR